MRAITENINYPIIKLTSDDRTNENGKMLKIIDNDSVTKLYFSSESEIRQLYETLKDYFENLIKPSSTNESYSESTNIEFSNNSVLNKRKIK